MSRHFSKAITLCCLTAGLFLDFAGRSIFAADVETNMSVILMEMKDKDVNIRLGAIGKLNRSVLNKQPVKTRDEVIASLAFQFFGLEAGSAVPALIEVMKRKTNTSAGEALCASILERIGTPEALEAIKPHKQKIARQIKLMKNPIKALRDSLSGTFAMTFGFLGLFWWSRSRCKKGDRIISWPLLIPVPFWGFCIYEAFWLRANTGAIITFFEAEFYFDIGLLGVTLAGIVPWLLITLWKKMHTANGMGSIQKIEKNTR